MSVEINNSSTNLGNDANHCLSHISDMISKMNPKQQRFVFEHLCLKTLIRDQMEIISRHNHYYLIFRILPYFINQLILYYIDCSDDSDISYVKIPNFINVDSEKMSSANDHVNILKQFTIRDMKQRITVETYTSLIKFICNVEVVLLRNFKRCYLDNFFLETSGPLKYDLNLVTYYQQDIQDYLNTFS